MTPTQIHTATLYNGDCLAVLRGLPDNSLDACVCDPPYGLGRQSPEDVIACLRAWVAGEAYAPKGRGFMGHAWDAWVPGPEVWREVYRVLKPGGHLAAFAGSRTYDLMGMAIRLSGFEIRDGLYWSYGSGFPKSHNISNEIDKRNGAPNRGRAIPVASTAQAGGGAALTGNPVPEYEPRTPEGAAWKGWGTALKPAVEPIVLARKPLQGTLAENVTRWGTGALNIDACRVRTAGEVVSNHARGAEAAQSKGIYGDSAAQETHQTSGQRLGRWPPNLLLTHSEGCRCVGQMEVAAAGGDVSGEEPSAWTATTYGEGSARRPFQAHGEGGREVVEVYACVEGCPVEMVGRQSGERKGSGVAAIGGTARKVSAHIGQISGRERTDAITNYGDTGIAARFFPYLDYGANDLPGADTEDMPLLYTPKASRSEREAGCEALPARSGAEAVQREEGSAGTRSPSAGAGRTAREVRCTHPTVKPVAVMGWLLRLLVPAGGVAIDPFVGSGTTAIAGVRAGVRVIGIEREPEYFAIAAARVRHAAKGAEPAPEPVKVAEPVKAPEVSDTRKGRRRREVAETEPVVQVAPGQLRLFGGEGG